MDSATKILSSDQHFLLNFIMSNYLGPDLFFDNPRCSASQRLVRRLPPYTLKHIGSSALTFSQLESLYHYVLRYAKPDLVIEADIFHAYLKGDLPLLTSDSTVQYRCFTSFFPLNVHEHKRYSASHEVVKGIVVIDDPAVSYIQKEDLERFKCLSCLNDLKIDRVVSLSHQNSSRTEDDLVSGQIHNSSIEIHETKREDEKALKTSERFVETYKRRRYKRSLQKTITIPNEDIQTETDQLALLPPASNTQEHVPDPSVRLNGTATKGALGVHVGVVDIGISKVAYFFQVSLPGLSKDHSDFSCEIESCGKVVLQGLMSGGKRVKKRSRVFEMSLRQLCTGPFTVSFMLPGPVDPRLVSPNFRSDGIFEAVIIRHESPN